MRRAGLIGMLILAFAWGGPLPGQVAESFVAHMLLHMAVVGLAVPLIALGLAPRVTGHLPAGLLLPVMVSLADLVVVWTWHAPLPHEAARSSLLWLTVEQLSFFAISLMVWLLALAGRDGRSDLAGALTLFFTSMHMTLLGALLALSHRDLYPGLGLLPAHAGHAVTEQQIGGAIMLVIGGVIYLGGALWLVSRVLRGAEAS